jgi:hypothetical protein
MPVTVALGCFVGALLVALIAGFGHGSILAALIAAGGACAAGVGVWQGAQKETQKTMATSLVLLLANLGLAGLTLVLRLISIFR